MATETIRNMLKIILPTQADETYKYLSTCRHHLTHGRSPESLEKKVGLPLNDLVDKAAAVAWHIILEQFNLPENIQLKLAHRDGKFTHNELLVGSEFVLSHDDGTAHPSEEKLLRPVITVQTYFRDPPESYGT